MAQGQGGRHLDPGIRVVLDELRDLRLEMRADRRRADEERRKADEQRRQERRRSDERFEELLREFRHDSTRREAATQRALTDIRAVGLSIVKTLNRHTRILEHNTQILDHTSTILERSTAILEGNTAILERNTTILEHNTTILERMDRKLGTRRNGHPGPNDRGRHRS